MNVAIQVDERTAKALQAQAADRGMSLETYLETIARDGHERPKSLSPAEAVRNFNKVLDDLFARETRPLPPEIASTRDDIYFDHA